MKEAKGGVLCGEVTLFLATLSSIKAIFAAVYFQSRIERHCLFFRQSCQGVSERGSGTYLQVEDPGPIHEGKENPVTSIDILACVFRFFVSCLMYHACLS